MISGDITQIGHKNVTLTSIAPLIRHQDWNTNTDGNQHLVGIKIDPEMTSLTALGSDTFKAANIKSLSGLSGSSLKEISNRNFTYNHNLSSLDGLPS